MHKRPSLGTIFFLLFLIFFFISFVLRGGGVGVLITVSRWKMILYFFDEERKSILMGKMARLFRNTLIVYSSYKKYRPICAVNQPLIKCTLFCFMHTVLLIDTGN